LEAKVSRPKQKASIGWPFEEAHRIAGWIEETRQQGALTDPLKAAKHTLLKRILGWLLEQMGNKNESVEDDEGSKVVRGNYCGAE
jgi:hypothetical protein